MTMKTSPTGDDELRRRLTGICDEIARTEETLHVFVPGTHSRERVLEELDRLLARFPSPDKRPPLFGVPVGVKDIIHCDGHVTRCGSDLPPELFQGAEAVAMTRLKDAGAIVMGKTATTEFAYFAPAETRNPVNPDHTPGGSSSGSAAGVAACFFDYALGTQTVGSVIRPASYCGIAGFKPSLGRIATQGVIPFSWTVDHVGVFGRSASGLPAVLGVLDHQWKSAPPPNRVKLGVPVGAYIEQAEMPALGLYHERMRRIEAAGCELFEVPVLEDIEEINRRHNRLIAGEIARVHAPWFEEQKKRYRSVTREIIEKGMSVEEAELVELRDSCHRLRKTLSARMADNGLDAWICPSTTGEAPKGLATTGSPLMNLPWTHSGLPAVTIPSGCGPAGLPLGIQLVGDFMADERLIALATVVEQMLEG